jgi:hypothetical protein
LWWVFSGVVVLLGIAGDCGVVVVAVVLVVTSFLRGAVVIVV